MNTSVAKVGTALLHQLEAVNQLVLVPPVQVKISASQTAVLTETVSNPVSTVPKNAARLKAAVEAVLPKMPAGCPIPTRVREFVVRLFAPNLAMAVPLMDRLPPMFPLPVKTLSPPPFNSRLLKLIAGIFCALGPLKITRDVPGASVPPVPSLVKFPEAISIGPFESGPKVVVPEFNSTVSPRYIPGTII